MKHMKVNKYFVVVVTVLLVKSVFGLPDSNIANKYFLEKQKFLFEIVHNVQEPLQNEEWINMGRTLVTDKSHYLDFNSIMENYLLKVNKNLLLPQDDIFILANERHLEELKGLYYFLYYVQDFEALKQNICWARTHVQAQMFIYALTQILMKREDLKSLNLPKIYEIWPEQFFADKYIRNLQHFNNVQWSNRHVYEEYFQDTNVSKFITCRNGQWWCKKNLEFKIYREKHRKILPKNVYGDFRNSIKWFKALEDVSFYLLPVDFSKEFAKSKELSERSITYLIEDKSWNAYWYYINMGLWLNKRGENDLYSKPLRDWWFWNLKQIVVRYKLEDKNQIFIVNLDPLLINFQGLKYKPIDKIPSWEFWTFINDLFAKTQDALNGQTYELYNKTILQLNDPQHFEYFLNENFAIEKIMNSFMSFKNRNKKHPTVLQYFETMLRSKEFYYYSDIIVKLYELLKAKFEPYEARDLQNVGININDVQITELQTYFELVDTDVTNLMRSSNAYFEGTFLWFKSLLVRQQSLQHQTFKFLFNITSDKPQAVLVRTFLTAESAQPDLFQLDTFITTLATGFNIIERDSNNFYGYMSPSLTTTELYHFANMALNEEYQFPYNISMGNCRFSHHLKLPKGINGKGLPVKFVFVITAYNYRLHKAFNLDCDFSSGIFAFDDFPPGFPFDRNITHNTLMYENIFIKEMKIYHNENVLFR